VEAIGHDRPGIVREMTRVLADHGVNIEEFETRVSSASFSAEQMFHARARLAVPERVSDDRLRIALERLGNEMMVDITLEPPGTKD
jgi:glycine cleavage system regulatory protein